MENLKQRIINYLEDNQKLRDKFHQEDLFINSENIKQKRQLVHLFITISSGIIGGLLLFSGLLLFKGSILIKNIAFVYGGVVFFLFLILYGFYYLVWVLTTEGRQIDKQKELFTTGLQNVESQMIEYLQNPDDNNDAIKKAQKSFIGSLNNLGREFQQKDKKFRSGLWFTFTLFLFGLVALIIAILPISLNLCQFIQ